MISDVALDRLLASGDRHHCEYCQRLFETTDAHASHSTPHVRRSCLSEAEMRKLGMTRDRYGFWNLPRRKSA